MPPLAGCWRDNADCAYACRPRDASAEWRWGRCAERPVSLSRIAVSFLATSSWRTGWYSRPRNGWLTAGGFFRCRSTSVASRASRQFLRRARQSRESKEPLFVLELSQPRSRAHIVGTISNYYSCPPAMKYLAILSAILLVMFDTTCTLVEARIGSEKIVAHRQVEEVVNVARDRSQLAHRELKVCRKVRRSRRCLCVH